MIACKLGDQSIDFTIEDEGNGFDWEKYLALDPDRMFDPHGRGIAFANMQNFSEIQYQGKGNIVTYSVKLQ